MDRECVRVVCQYNWPRTKDVCVFWLLPRVQSRSRQVAAFASPFALNSNTDRPSMPTKSFLYFPNFLPRIEAFASSPRRALILSKYLLSNGIVHSYVLADFAHQGEIRNRCCSCCFFCSCNVRGDPASQTEEDKANETDGCP